MAGARKPRLLVVEDNVPDVQLFAYALEQAQLDCEMTVIEDGGAALAFVGQRGTASDIPIPDLAVIDLNLPKNDGIEILQAMRANPLFAGVPVLLLSTSSPPREIAKIEAFGNVRYATKPSFLEQYTELGNSVRSMLERRLAAG